jgi:predicted transcriptional regulator
MALGPLDSDRQARIAKIAELQGVRPEDVLAGIVDDYFRRLEELQALLDEGLADVKAGRVYSPDQVREHMKAYAAGIKLTDESA